MTGGEFVTGKDKLADEALRLKKAWLLTVAWVGIQTFRGRIGSRELSIPDYHSWKKKDLNEYLPILLNEFNAIVKSVTTVKTRRQQDRAISWMARQFDRCLAAKFGIVSICTAQEFERDVGPLLVRASIDIPPYAELLVQGWEGLAFRHPEYHLSRDLQLFFSLAQDAEDLLHGVDLLRPPMWAPHASENSQSLNRATIQTCFSLLESFTTGLGRAFVMENPKLDKQTQEKVQDDEKKLAKRIVAIPELIAGRPSGLDLNKPPISELFGPIKQRRDAFVHCVPGQTPHRGYVKEAAFHDVPWNVVKQAVTLTIEIIEHVWGFLNSRKRPSWLPTIGSDGRFEGENLRLSPKSPTSANAATK